MINDQRGDGSRLVKNDVSSYFVVRHRWIHFFERCVLFVFFSCLPRRNNSSITTGLALKVGFCFCNTLTIHHTTTCFLSNNIRAPHLDCLCQVVLLCAYPHHTRPSNCVPFLVHDCFCILSCSMHHTTYLSQRIQFKYEMTSINLLSTLGQVSIIENFGDHLLVRKNQYHRLSDGGCRS